MPTPFPGMDLYLERRQRWHAVHTRLIVALSPQVRPRYRVDIELHTYFATSEEIRERYLIVREVATEEVITVIEVLSLANKLTSEGRDEYSGTR